MRRLYIWIDKHPLIKSGFFPFIAALPPAVVGAKDWLPATSDWFARHYVVAMLCAFVWPLLLFAFAGIYNRIKVNTPVQVQEMSLFVAILSRVVAVKTNRMTEFMQSLPPIQKTKSRDLKSRDVVKATIDPKEQLNGIVHSVHSFFDYNTESGNIRVALAKMGSVHIEEWVAFYPQNSLPKSSLDSLRKDTCGFTVARRTGRIHIVSSFVEEGKKANNVRGYEITDENRADEDGSMICYPIHDPLTRTIPYVIAVCSDQCDIYKNSPDQVATYKYVLDQFAQRVLLEHYWMTLKERMR